MTTEPVRGPPQSLRITGHLLTSERWLEREALFAAKGCAIARGCWRAVFGAAVAFMNRGGVRPPASPTGSAAMKAPAMSSLARRSPTSPWATSLVALTQTAHDIMDGFEQQFAGYRGQLPTPTVGAGAKLSLFGRRESAWSEGCLPVIALHASHWSCLAAGKKTVFESPSK